MSVSGTADLLLTFCFCWLPLDGSTCWNLNYIQMAKKQENLAGYLKCLFKVVCKNANLALESTTTVLNRNANLAVKGLKRLVEVEI